jgi:hypothetical protein
MSHQHIFVYLGAHKVVPIHDEDDGRTRRVITVVLECTCGGVKFFPLTPHEPIAPKWRAAVERELAETGRHLIGP